MVTFRIYNEEHTWKLSHLDEVLGLPTEGPRLTSKYWDINQLWRRMGPGTDFDSKGSSNSLIRHPALRYVHKVLANTIFGREENSKVRRDEIYMLEHMLHAKPIDIGAFLIRQMLSNVKKETTSGAIVLGGLITPIALHLGHSDRLIQDGLVEGSDSIDISACSFMGWIHKKEGTVLWRLGNDDEEELPPPKAMTLRVQENWSFRPTHLVTSSPSAPEPPVSSPPCEGTRSAAALTLESLQSSIDEIKVEQVILSAQKEIKDQLASISTTLTGLGAWLHWQGFSHPSLPPP
ncbi:DNA polymerase III PolC-type [Bienertia sinuspersici]